MPDVILYLGDQIIYPSNWKKPGGSTAPVDKLDGILQPDCRLIFVSAPPGFGKTTLISTWVSSLKSIGHQPSPSVAWLSLDDRDNDPIIFWIYFASALQVTQVGIGKDALTLLQDRSSLWHSIYQCA
jgi:ATP/maltotriose-dependent transcriptional regulator MalT